MIIPSAMIVSAGSATRRADLGGHQVLHGVEAHRPQRDDLGVRAHRSQLAGDRGGAAGDDEEGNREGPQLARGEPADGLRAQCFGAEGVELVGDLEGGDEADEDRGAGDEA
jgi:hypothetical protein